MSKCKICGEEFDANTYVKDIKKELEENQMCFLCNFWRDMLEKDAERPPHTWCMIDGTHYVIEPDDPKSHFQGFGGNKFTIKFDDGVIVETHNLWCQGEPSEYWIDKFPNNAKFEDNRKWRKIGEYSYLL